MSIVDWSIEPKTPRARFGIALGCLAALALALPLLFLSMASAAIPHCKTCGANLGLQMFVGLLIAIFFGGVMGVIAAFARESLRRMLGPVGAMAALLLVIAATAFMCLEPALRFVTSIN